MAKHYLSNSGCLFFLAVGAGYGACIKVCSFYGSFCETSAVKLIYKIDPLMVDFYK